MLSNGRILFWKKILNFVQIIYLQNNLGCAIFDGPARAEALFVKMHYNEKIVYVEIHRQTDMVILS